MTEVVLAGLPLPISNHILAVLAMTRCTSLLPAVCMRTIRTDVFLNIWHRTQLSLTRVTLGAVPSTHSRICSPSHAVSALPLCPHLGQRHAAIQYFATRRIFCMAGGRIGGREIVWDWRIAPKCMETP